MVTLGVSLVASMCVSYLTPVSPSPPLQLTKRDITLVDQSGVGVKLTVWGETAQKPSSTFQDAILAIKGIKVPLPTAMPLSPSSIPSLTPSLPPFLPSLHSWATLAVAPSLLGRPRASPTTPTSPRRPCFVSGTTRLARRPPLRPSRRAVAVVVEALLMTLPSATHWRTLSSMAWARLMRYGQRSQPSQPRDDVAECVRETAVSGTDLCLCAVRIRVLSLRCEALCCSFEAATALPTHPALCRVKANACARSASQR